MVNWYLKEIESEIDSEEELINRKGLIEKVIHRLVHYVSPPSTEHEHHTRCKRCLTRRLFSQDHILIELSQAGLKGSESESASTEGAVLVVNPNYILDD